AERGTIVGLPDPCLPNANATRVNLCTNASITSEYAAPSAGDYRVSAVVIPFPNTSGVRQPIMEVRIDGRAVATITVPGSGVATTVSAVVPVTRSGVVDVAVAFVNDSGEGGDRNLAVDNFSVEGPIAGSTPGVENGTRDTRARIATLASRILQRPFADDDDDDDIDETAPLYDVLLAMDAFQPEARDLAWAGVCEAVMQHPDFLFTRAPSFDTATDPGLKERFLATQAALVLVDRTPTAAELSQLDVGEATRNDLIETWLDSDAHHASYLNRVREILEFDGTPDGEEPARLWAYLEKNDRPLKEVLTADYTVDVDGNRSDRPAFHGQTGVLTMKGYIVGKPGLPAYNYAARVMTGFMGRVFEVPQAALDARATATAISTVDPTSLCFSCHNVLTPLAHQRLKWDNAGNHRETFDDGRAIDDSDNDLVAGYPYKGVGLEAFTLVAVKKEAFARRMANAHFLMVFGRLLRLEGDTADEGAVYRRLFDAIDAGNGTFKDIERLILTSSSVTTPRIATAVEPMTGLLGLAGGEQ
ncbi:MAG TPA: carbohydrate-binding domain-containing protein, partial [Myxococcota bacterium]